MLIVTVVLQWVRVQKTRIFSQGNTQFVNSILQQHARDRELLAHSTTTSSITTANDRDNDRHRFGKHTILISGESGSGKSEVANRLVNQLLHGQTNESTTTSCSALHTAVLQSQHILQSFGNAHTTHCGNSSRFGQLLSLGFAENRQLQTASVETYLLESVRVCTQRAGERNFHVFYEMFAGLSPSQLIHLGLINELDDGQQQQLSSKVIDNSIRSFAYLYNNSNNHNASSDSSSSLLSATFTSDSQRFQSLVESLSFIGMNSTDDQLQLWNSLAAIVLLGQIQFQSTYEQSVEGCIIVGEQQNQHDEEEDTEQHNVKSTSSTG